MDVIEEIQNEIVRAVGEVFQDQLPAMPVSASRGAEGDIPEEGASLGHQ